MSALFDLLQGQIERWDGICDQTLCGGKKKRKKKDMEPEHFNLKRWTSCSVYLRRRVCGRHHEGGVG